MNSIRSILFIIAFAAWNSLGFADDYSKVGQHFYWGSCELPRDPLGGRGPADLWLMSCVDAQIGHEAGFVAGDPKSHTLLDYAEGYGGLHLLSWMSVHGSGHIYRWKAFSRPSDVEPNLESRRDYLILRIGNPVIHKYHLSVGELAMPVGINYSQIPLSFQRFQSEEFWASPKHAATLAYDTQTNFSWELSLGTDYYFIRQQGLENPDEDKLPVEDIPDALAFRTSYDIAALDGTRLTTSFYAHNSGERRGGLGLVTVSAKGDITHFDWIRKFRTPDIREFPFEQLVRFGYQSVFRGGNRWLVQFDDHRKSHRMGFVGNDLKVVDWLLLRIGLGLKRDLGIETYKDQWYGSLGIEAGL